jgi:hypothetical protein
VELGTVLFRFALFDLEAIPGLQMTNLSQPNRQQLGCAVRRVDADDEQREVAGGEGG